jgi:hypothetical protein
MSAGIFMKRRNFIQTIIAAGIFLLLPFKAKAEKPLTEEVEMYAGDVRSHACLGNVIDVGDPEKKAPSWTAF